MDKVRAVWTLLVIGFVSACGGGSSDAPASNGSSTSAGSSASSSAASSTPNTHVYWSESFVEGAEFTTSEVRSPQITLQISVDGLPSGGIYLQRTPSTTGVITGAIFSQPTFSPQYGVAFAQYDVSLKPPAALGSGVFTDSMHFRACFDAACMQVVPESDYTLSLDFIVSASEGVEFTQRTLALTNGVTNVVWSSQNQSLYIASSLYASNGSVNPGIDPQVIQVDPSTLAVGKSITLTGENLDRMAVSMDGSYLYVSSKTKSLLHRLQLPSMMEDLSIPLGSASPYYPNVISDLAMISGQPQSFVAALESSSYNLGIYVYDNEIPRTSAVAPVQGFEPPRWLVPTDAADTFITQSYGPSVPKINALTQVKVNVAGVNTISSTPIADEFVIPAKPQRSGMRLFTIDGKIRDAATGAQIGSLSLPDSSYLRSILVDEAHGRIFVWMPVRQTEYVLSYDLATLKLLAFAPVYSASGASYPSFAKMALWGNDGVALVDGQQLIVLSGSFFTTYRGEPTLTITTPTT